LAETHAPEIASNFGVHLTNNIHENSIVVLGDRAVGYKLGDDRCLTIDLVLEERVEVLVVRVVRHNDQEDKLRLGSSLDVRLNTAIVIELNALCESFQ